MPAHAHAAPSILRIDNWFSGQQSHCLTTTSGIDTDGIGRGDVMNKIFNDWPCQNRRVSVGASNHTETPSEKKKVAHVAAPHATATPVENENAQAKAGNSCGKLRPKKSSALTAGEQEGRRPSLVHSTAENRTDVGQRLTPHNPPQPPHIP